MASVSFHEIEKSFGSTKVIHGIGFDIKDGEFMVLVGPSGCGKSTLLRMLAGLEEITAGTIAIDSKVVNDVESKDRDIAMVFQSYALYPHMTVAANMAFSLKLRKADAKTIEERVARAAKILNLDPYLHRYPRELSGGQRQRVAMGRAIVRDPKVFLFDEPLSNLDAKLRVAMRAEIKALHQRLKTTTVYVTHDQVEAMTMADRIVVMHDGRIEQIGTPLDLYDKPDNLFVAQFIGSPAMNVVDGAVRRSAGSAFVEVAGGVRWPLFGAVGTEGHAVTYGVRPEHLTLGAASDITVPAEIIVVEPTGAETELLIQAGDAQVILRTHGRPSVNPGD
jgi:multiple sugar transport system ATP-binding protein